MLPWYSPQHQRTQLVRMKEVAEAMVKVWMNDIPLDQPCDMRDWMTRYSLEISGRGACNYDFRLLAANPQRSPFAKAVPEAMKEALLRVVEPSPDKQPLIGNFPISIFMSALYIFLFCLFALYTATHSFLHCSAFHLKSQVHFLL